MQGLIGYAGLLALAFALSENRRAIPWRTVIGALALQWALALLFLAWPAAQQAILALNAAADALQHATDQGTAFLFGYLAGPPLPFNETRPGASFILAFKMLPLVLVVSAISALLFHWGILQRIAALFAALLRRALGIDGPLAIAAAVHIFVGMIEAPLLIRPWLARMQRGELFAVMTCGLAGVAGTVMVIYATILTPVLPNALGQIIVASVVSTPAALAVAALMVPFHPPTETTAATLHHTPADSTLDALVRGTADGIAPLVGIATTLIVTITLVTLLNTIVGALPLPGSPPAGGAWTLQSLLALPLRPILWAIGLPWPETAHAALLMGTKTILNEFAAYLQLAALPDSALSPRGRQVMTFALCGFANLGSVGILVGGLGQMIPDRRPEIVRLGLRSLLSGSIATLLSAAIVGLIG